MIGNLLITGSIITGIFTVIMYYYTFKGYSNTLVLARRGFYFMTGFVVAASGLLLYLILSHQYQYNYVFEYSSSSLSFGLLLSSFFAGQEGSFLLWLLFFAIFGIFLIRALSEDSKSESSFMMVYTLISLFLAVLISPFLKNPFTSIWADPNYLQLKYFNSSYLGLPDLQKFIVSDNKGVQFLHIGTELKAVLSALNIPDSSFIIAGKGLNPLLQNFWMQIHPPLLFVGFAMAGIPYSFAMSAIIRKDYRTWVSKSLPWLAASMSVLGLAIMIGGYWAYGVLGWGGFWGWDPVENSSLVPWIIGTALIHTLIIQKNTQMKTGKGKYIRTNLILSIFTFVLVIYSTFLTRSGILSEASVHSFTAPGRITYIFLVGFILTFTILGIGGVAARWKEFKSLSVSEEAFFSRENGLLYGSAVMLGSALIIILGTSSPIFGSSVETSFYTTMNFPMVIMMMFLIAITLILRWRNTDKKELVRKLMIHLIISAVMAAAIAIITEMSSGYFITYTLAASFTIITNISTILKNLKINYMRTGGQIAHIGIGVFLLGVLLSGNFSQSVELNLPKGKEIKALKHNFIFTGYDRIQNSNKYSFNVMIRDENKTVTTRPVMFISDLNNSLMREPDIIPGLGKDIYISPLGYEENSDQYSDSGSITYKDIVLKKGESFEFNDARITFTKFMMPEEAMKGMMNGNKFNMGAKLDISYRGKDYTIEPSIQYSDDKQNVIPTTFEPADIKFELLKLDASGVINLNVSGNNSADQPVKQTQEILTVEASIKQNMGLVWIGVVLITIGFLIAALRRKRENSAL